MVDNILQVKVPTFGDFVKGLARTFLDGLVKIAQHYDSLPLEEKHQIKSGLIALLAAGGTDAKHLKYLTRDDDELKQFLSKGGWWVLHKDITGEVKRDLLEFGRKEQFNEIDSYLCTYFKKDGLARLHAKVELWFQTDYLRKRKQIVLDCLEAHQAGKYTLTIPTLLPLVDGLTRQFRKSHSRFRRTNNPNRVVHAKQFAAYYGKKEPKLWGAPFAKFIREIAFTHYEFGESIPSTSFNRHGILHGDIPDYATEVNSLKVFLLLDTIAQFVIAFQKRLPSKTSGHI